MPEFMGVKVSRAQESARHAYRRELEKAVRVVGKGTGWKSTQGCLFRNQSGWFISVTPLVYIYEPRTNVRIGAKPMGVDPIFWDIVGLPENGNMPLSFRLNGAWTCPTPQFAEVEIDESDDVHEVARRVLESADRQAVTCSSLSVEDFLQACRSDGAGENPYLASQICALIATGHELEALNICNTAKAAKAVGGFMGPEGTFPEMASKWLTRAIDDATRH